MAEAMTEIKAWGLAVQGTEKGPGTLLGQVPARQRSAESEAKNWGLSW